MPVYEYKCKNCSTKTEDIYAVDDRPSAVPCSHCGGVAHRYFSPMNFRMGIIEPYFDKALGMTISSNTQRAKIIEERGLVEIGNEPSDYYAKTVAKEQEKKDAAVRQDAIKFMGYLEEQGG